ncbi:hypothetical protein EV363DRAFT_890402 [Boletus edulis]|nr:hypothetical protein EV363DRAFT_890402 [Boletus edulis]
MFLPGSQLHIVLWTLLVTLPRPLVGMKHDKVLDASFMQPQLQINHIHSWHELFKPLKVINSSHTKQKYVSIDRFRTVLVPLITGSYHLRRRFTSSGKKGLSATEQGS